jgi:predicted ATPase/predicted Ser/Thr protein kinase
VSSGFDIPATLAGYRIERELGRGGMGRVYEAEHVQLQRKLALKVLAPHLTADEAFRERFVRESQLLAAIDHPNIIPIYDAGEAEGLLYIAMRYVDGADLKALLEREGPLEAERALALVEQVADALDAAHARDLVHRDVKPANVLVDAESDRIFLTDFGLAKRLRGQGLSGAGLFLGTVDYASPEQIEGRPVTPAVDVYGLGCLLYECLTGRPPFPKETDVAVVHAHLLEPPPQVTASRPDLPDGLDGVIARALAKSADMRYASCGDLVADARAALGGRRAPTIAATPRPAGTVVAAPAPAQVPSTLPTHVTPFVGRVEELDALRDLILRDDVRLVTLTGPGGTGKTRLATEAASGLGDAFPHGLFFVDLASLSEPSLVLPRIAEALGVEEAAADGADGVLEALRGRLRQDRLLLVLDNFEQVLAAAPVVADVLAAGPAVKVLVTSRGSLRLRGEREYPLTPLPLPEREDAADPEAAARSPAVALFVESAQAVRPEFELTPENTAAVSEICLRLDGLPLAIELAAAWVKLLSPAEILGRLEQRLELLTGGALDRPSRHQTLREAIGWSYELLDPEDQRLFARLGVFTGGCTLESAEAVAGGEVGRPVLDALSSLADKSLVRRREGADGRTRIAMLQTIHEYALYRLVERGELEELRSRHAEHFLGLVEEAEPELVGPDQERWVRRLEDESGNVRAALDWSLESGPLELGLRIAGSLTRFWSIRGHMSEGRGWLDLALARDAEVAPAVRAKAAYASGYAALGQGDFSQADARFAESLSLYRELGDRRGTALSLAQQGWLLTTRGDVGGATAVSEESLALARELDDKRTASVALSNLAEAAVTTGDLDRATELYEEALALRRDVGDRRNVANALLNLGRTELARGEVGRATVALEEGLALARDLDDTWSISVAANALAHAALRQADDDRAAELLRDALAAVRRRGDKRMAAEALQTAAALAATRDEPARAARLWGAANALRESTGASPSAVELAAEDAWLAPARAKAADEAFELELTAGRRLELDDAVAAALGDGARDAA